MRAVFALVGALGVWSLSATATAADPSPCWNLSLSSEIGTRAPAGVFPPAEQPRPQVAPWAAAFMSGGLTIAGVVASAALVPDNNAGIWVAAVSVWLLPGVGNIAVGNNRVAGALWAARTVGLAMMIPGVDYLRGGSYGHLIVDQILVMMVGGALTLAGGVILDVLSAYGFAQKIRADGFVLRF